MPFAQKIVLHCPFGYRTELDALVEQFLADGVRFVGVVGAECARVEDIIDELVVGDGRDAARFILTSSHPDDSVDEVVAFARSISTVGDGEPQVVVLGA